MSLQPRQQVLLIVISTILSSFSFFSIINFTDPETSGLSTFIFLYLSLFLLSLGIFTLLGLTIRLKVSPGHYVANLYQSFRQALLLSILLVCSFLLLSKNLLFWWVEGSIILFLISIEAFFNLKA